MRRPAPAAFLVGVAFGFVAAVDLVVANRLPLLLDRDPSWALPRLLLGLGVITGAAAAAAAAAGAFFLFADRWRPSGAPIPPLPWRPATLAAIAAAALLAGGALRFVSLERIPPSLWIDDLSLIAPALELSGVPADFANAIRPAPFGVGKVYGSVGVLYLEAYRLSLKAFGTTVFGVRFPAAAAGVCSIVLVYFLGRALLPRGGDALAALLFAGMRWGLILSRWGWNAVVLAPVVDAAALVLLAARRRRSAVLAAAAGAIAGLAAHLYLGAWVAFAALFLFSAWPMEAAGPEPSSPALARWPEWRVRARLPLAFAAAFAVFAAPLFLLREGRTSPYFARASDHNLLSEIRYTGSPMPAFTAAADSLVAPWVKPDPDSRNDLPGKTRLGWLLAVPVALAIGRSVARPREERSGFFLSHAAAAFAASVAGGQAGLPNGYRFGYLADVTAVAASAGLLMLAGSVPVSRRRTAALAAFSIAVVVGVLGARDALVRWPQRQETFDRFHGQDTLVARTALRWERFGPVAVTIDPVKLHSAITVGAVRRYRLDPDGVSAPLSLARFALRIEPPGAPPQQGERRVETIRDAWGREWGVVWAMPAGGARAAAPPKTG